MKKLLFLIISVLAVCAAAFAGCSGKSDSNGSILRERLQTLIEEQNHIEEQNEGTDCEDGDCEDKTEFKIPDVHINPIPRTPRKRGNEERTIHSVDEDQDDEGEVEETPEEDERPCPHKRHRKHRRMPAPQPERTRIKPRK